MVDKHHPIPVYFQLKQELLRRIEAGEWESDNRLPSEVQLSKMHGISRMTVRQALGQLVDEGVLRRERGRGTFVAKPKIHKRLSSLTSFSDDARARGKQATAHIIQLELRPAPAHVVEALEIAPGELVIVLERLRSTNDDAVAIERCYLYFPHCEELLHDDLTTSLYRKLREKYRVFPTSADERIEAGACPTREARLLSIRPGSPVLRITRVTTSQDKRPFEYVESVYRADQYVLHVSLTVT